MQKPKSPKPDPPEDLSDEQLLEWHRITDELDEAGLLNRVDRALITLYCETWAQWKRVTNHVNKFGPVLPAHNKVVGRSPFYVAQRELSNELARLLVFMGLTPASKGRKAQETSEEDILKSLMG